MRAARRSSGGRLGARPTSNTSGPANSASYRLPDTYQSTTLSPAPYRRPPKFGIAHRGPAHEVGSGNSTAALVGRRVQQGGVGAQPVPLLRSLAERQHPLGDRDPGGLVARDHQDREEVVEVGLAQPVRRPPRPAAAGQQVVTGIAEPAGHDRPAQVPQLLAVGAAERGTAGRRRCRRGPQTTSVMSGRCGDEAVARSMNEFRPASVRPMMRARTRIGNLLGDGVHEVESRTGHHRRGERGVKYLPVSPRRSAGRPRTARTEKAPDTILRSLCALAGRVSMIVRRGRHVLVGGLLEREMPRAEGERCPRPGWQRQCRVAQTTRKPEFGGASSCRRRACRGGAGELGVGAHRAPTCRGRSGSTACVMA